MPKRNITASEAAAIIGRLGGAAGTEAQKQAARTNGKLGGRPRHQHQPGKLVKLTDAAGQALYFRPCKGCQVWLPAEAE